MLHQARLMVSPFSPAAAKVPVGPSAGSVASRTGNPPAGLPPSARLCSEATSLPTLTMRAAWDLRSSGSIDAGLVRDVQRQDTYVASVGGQFFGGTAAPACVPRTQVHEVAGLDQNLLLVHYHYVTPHYAVDWRG